MNDLNLIVKMQFGSHVYGTDLPTSDLDYKAVYLPTADEKCASARRACACAR